MNHEPSRLHRGAHKYADHGVYVLPIVRGGKLPLTGHGVYDATISHDQIDRWWRATPNANVGIACGQSGWIVIDVDAQHGGIETLDELQADHGPLPVTLTATTPSGGFHAVYKMPAEPLGCPRLARGIDTRGTGGYIVATPSTRPEGVYRWLNWGQDMVPLPAWCETLLRPPPPPEPVDVDIDTAKELVEPLLRERREAVATARKARNNTLYAAAVELGGLVKQNLVDRSKVETTLTDAALKAGLNEREITATIRSGLERASK